MPGDTDEYDWTGTVPFDELPYSYNPECGYVASANNKTTGRDYPHYISNWFFLPYRAERIREMLEEKEKLSPADFEKMQTDTKSTHPRLFADMIPILERAKDFNETEKKALELLNGWDGIQGKDSAAAAIFQTFYVVMLKNLIRDELGDELYSEYMDNKVLGGNLMLNVWRSKKSPWCDDTGTNHKETFTDWVHGSFKETVGQLRSKLGDDPLHWQWGKIHHLTLRHPLSRVRLLDILFNLSRGPFDREGSLHTICPYSFSFKNPFKVIWGPSHRHIYPTADWNQSRSVIPTGISGIPAAPHYCDQTGLFLEGRYHNDFFDMPAVMESAAYKMVIQ
jgi:penicillin amidase